MPNHMQPTPYRHERLIQQAAVLAFALIAAITVIAIVYVHVAPVIHSINQGLGAK